jgi:hypothetical protein
MAGVTWRMVDRKFAPNASDVSALGLELQYSGRVCGLSIQLKPAVSVRIQETQMAMEEFRRLRDALDGVLSGVTTA